jgi:hypothetical protein
MKQDYLTPFLKHLSLQMPEQVSEYINTTGIDNILQKGGDDNPKNNNSETTALAKMIVNAIKSALTQSNKYLEERAKREKKIEADKKKIKSMTMANPIDMNYGGGILVFGPDFKIEEMIHMFYAGNTKPMYFSIPVEDTMSDNIVNTNIDIQTPYSSADITNKIKTIIK